LFASEVVANHFANVISFFCCWEVGLRLIWK